MIYIRPSEITYRDTIISIYNTEGVIVYAYTGKYNIISRGNNYITFEDEKLNTYSVHILTGFITIEQKCPENS